MSISVRSNLSDFAREIGILGNSVVFKVSGEALRDAIEEEFETLVQETPQWDGTTAASWSIGFRPGEHLREQPEREREGALYKGHQEAVDVALAANAGSIPGDFRGYQTADLVITNPAPGFETAEEGPVREVNQPAGALKAFESRFEDLVIEADFGKYND